jgi:hypothetical protein
MECDQSVTMRESLMANVLLLVVNGICPSHKTILTPRSCQENYCEELSRTVVKAICLQDAMVGLILILVRNIAWLGTLTYLVKLCAQPLDAKPVTL